jgi:HSP20 family protein
MNIVRQNQNQPQAQTPATVPAQQAPAEWNPFRMMRDLMRWDPFQEMLPLPELPATFLPSFDIKETPQGYVFKADLPGIAEKDVAINLTGNRLTITGKREEEKKEEKERYFACERTYGSFSRSFTLPDGVDLEKVTADMKQGVLTLSVPKKPEVQPKTIPIAPEKSKS